MQKSLAEGGGSLFAVGLCRGPAHGSVDQPARRALMRMILCSCCLVVLPLSAAVHVGFCARLVRIRRRPCLSAVRSGRCLLVGICDRTALGANLLWCALCLICC